MKTEKSIPGFLVLHRCITCLRAQDLVMVLLNVKKQIVDSFLRLAAVKATTGNPEVAEYCRKNGDSPSHGEPHVDPALPETKSSRVLSYIDLF